MEIPARFGCQGLGVAWGLSGVILIAIWTCCVLLYWLQLLVGMVMDTLPPGLALLVIGERVLLGGATLLLWLSHYRAGCFCVTVGERRAAGKWAAWR